MASPGSRLYRDRGIVLRAWKFGEADRIIVMLTLEHGKVRAVAKGVRKTTSSFGSRLEPTSHIEVQLHRGRELDVITQAERLDNFRELREDLDLFGRAVAMLEAVDQVAQDREPDEAVYRMLLGGLQAVAQGAGPAVVPAFFLKLLAQEGLSPQVDACVRCGAEEDLVAFNLDEGGVLCRAHRSGSAVSEQTIDMLRRTLAGGLKSVLEEPMSSAVHDFETLATRAMEYHLERRLRTGDALGH